ncbi:uncharacterized protein FOMMEDRAFT_103711 [Fomitiporia mediterranea MF3/22]|uniref:uncharacterized protein n=1 Tax=Fomitiporia mediterranea (strain MF3/22) TaxID=694068 RepID=UPI000440994B|nr:uncharacterized protein FOMMEDRAFT_103711 [Fomitiporia mediterranea MF3/22]EJD05590.1 hypothetical protein FOMMEDRAFT_103711 [Fomitiporia mediterranea MF3/22]
MPAAASISPFAPNPVKSRDDLQALLVGLLDALAPHTSAGGALICLGHTATHYDETAAQLEGFSRPIWGLASQLAGGGRYVGAKRWVNGFSSGSDPNHGEFWGDMRDKDQRMVECSAIGFSLAVAKETLWDPLSQEAKTNLENWLGGMNNKRMPDTNWLWFRVFANLGLSKVGSRRFDAERMKADLDHLDTFYVGDGWSRDGPETVCQFDYYSSSFAIQYAQLVYSKLMQEEDPKRCKEYKRRAKEFAIDFIRYFDYEGRAIPFGRSMTYRFAQSSFWGALAFAGVELPSPLTWGVVKGLQLRNIRYWAKQPGAFNPDGTLTIGFNYPNHNITENYNSPGSPYWCCKSFITLSLPPSHPFWTAEEEPYPESLRESVKPLLRPLHIATNRGGHTYILSSGQQCSYSLKQSAAKYGKFAYSSVFGYSVPVGIGTLAEAAPDSALALCDVETDSALEFWRQRRVTLDARFETGKDGSTWLHSGWRPWPDVDVETWLMPPSEAAPLWHLRVHRVRAGRRLRAAEGAFAIYGQRCDGRALDPVSDGSEEFGVHQAGTSARAASRAGVSGILALENSEQVPRKGEVLRLDANTNLIEARTVLPILIADIPGDGRDLWLITSVFALPAEEGREGARAGWLAKWESTKPHIPEEIAVLIG